LIYQLKIEKMARLSLAKLIQFNLDEHAKMFELVEEDRLLQW
jgi:hypothetical protein